MAVPGGLVRRWLVVVAVLAALLAPRAADAAFAQVQTNVQSGQFTSVTSATLTMSATGAGNLVTLGCSVSVAGSPTLSVSDTAGNTYVVSSPVDYSTFRMWMIYGVQASSATTVTFTFSTTVSGTCGADEYSGNASTNASAFDVSASGTGTGTSLATSTFTPAASGELIVGYAARQGAAANFSAGTSYSSTWTTSSFSYMEYRLSGTTSETAPITLSASRTWGEVAMAFKAPAATATPTPTVTPTPTPTVTPTVTPTPTPTPTVTPTNTPGPSASNAYFFALVPSH